jgi:hypothetical protein
VIVNLWFSFTSPFFAITKQKRFVILQSLVCSL